MDYNAPAQRHAATLRFYANRAMEAAKARRSEGKSWSEGDAERFEHQARRLLAMAALCNASPDVQVKNVDFQRLDDPTLSVDEETVIIENIEATLTSQ